MLTFFAEIEKHAKKIKKCSFTKSCMCVKVAANNLLSSLDESQMSREERRAIEQTPVELQQRYDALRLMMSERRVQYTGFFISVADPGSCACSVAKI
jgi:hypothetical protein